MTKSLVLWAVCELNGGGWKPVLGTIATTRKEAVTLYEWRARFPNAAEYARELRNGKAKAMRVEVRPIVPEVTNQ